MRMSKLGYTSRYEDLSEEKHEIFSYISQKLDKLEEMERRKKASKKPKKR